MDKKTGPGHCERMIEERQRLIRAVGVDLPALDSRTRAALEAFGEEVLALRREVDDLRRALQRAESLADFDTLCPVFNRRAFERELRREIALAERYGSVFSVVFMDLDRFKQVNDRFGHAMGDVVLVSVAETLVTHTRETDIVARLGGDEFAILLAHACASDSESKAADLARAIEKLRFPTGEHDSPQISPSASFGVAEWHRSSAPERLLATADQAMYAQKASRRAAAR